MGFRDDGEAARARAEALARELAERDAQIETLKAELEQKSAKLREVSEEASPILESAERAQQALEALKAKNAEHARAREAKARAKRIAEERAQTAEERAEAQEREKRLLRSLSIWAEVNVTLIAPVAGAPTFLGCLMLLDAGRTHYSGLLVVLFVLGVLAVKFYGRDWARRVARREQEWARALSYALSGYPEVLAIKPGSGNWIYGGEHRLLSVELDFASGEAPADLWEIMTGFDPELRTSNPLREAGAIEKRNVFHRFSPVTRTRSDSVEDHNRAVRDWVRRFEREVLRPLHARHPLTRVTVRLR